MLRFGPLAWLVGRNIVAQNEKRTLKFDARFASGKRTSLANHDWHIAASDGHSVRLIRWHRQSQREGERRSFSRRALHLHGAAVKRQEPARNREAESSPAEP
jgi:hypothetical protein